MHSQEGIASGIHPFLIFPETRNLIAWLFHFIFSFLSLQELQKYEQFIFADHTNMIHVENVYEEILHQILLDEALKGKRAHWALEETLWRGEPL